jgi:hypothetical protein
MRTPKRVVKTPSKTIRVSDVPVWQLERIFTRCVDGILTDLTAWRDRVVARKGDPDHILATLTQRRDELRHKLKKHPPRNVKFTPADKQFTAGIFQRGDIPWAEILRIVKAANCPYQDLMIGPEFVSEIDHTANVNLSTSPDNSGGGPSFGAAINFSAAVPVVSGGLPYPAATGPAFSVNWRSIWQYSIPPHPCSTRLVVSGTLECGFNPNPSSVGIGVVAPFCIGLLQPDTGPIPELTPNFFDTYVTDPSGQEPDGSFLADFGAFSLFPTWWGAAHHFAVYVDVPANTLSRFFLKWSLMGASGEDFASTYLSGAFWVSHGGQRGMLRFQRVPL